MAAKTAGRRRPVSWERDGVNGGPSSVDIILKWITAEGNLQRWRGDTVGGQTKKALASEIAGLIEATGIQGRTSKGKSADIQRQSGEGLLVEDEEKSFHDKLVRICKHWDVLDPVFHNRAPAKPVAPTGTFKHAKPFNPTPVHTNAQDDGVDGGKEDDFDFPFAVDYLISDEENKADDGGESVKAKEIAAHHTLVDQPETSEAPKPASEVILVNTDTSSEESDFAGTKPSKPHKDASGAAGTTKRTGKLPAKGKRGKPLTLKSNPPKKRKSLEDVMYDSICNRTVIAQQRSCIEIAQAKVKYTKELLELGIYSTEEVKAMVAAQFEG